MSKEVNFIFNQTPQVLQKKKILPLQEAWYSLHRLQRQRLSAEVCERAGQNSSPPHHRYFTQVST